MGYGSYPVPEFTWEKRTWTRFNTTRDLKELRKEGFDLVLHEDGGSWCSYSNRGALPFVYLSIDDTLSEDHLRNRVKQARQADLVLVDHGPLEPFKAESGRPVLRFNYCVNERIFHPREEKTTDVVFHCSAGARRGEPGASERIRVRQLLARLCLEHGWSYRSGVRGLDKYALSLAQARVVVNVPRTETNRPHRVFDTMASGSCLLTGPIPKVVYDKVEEGIHYVVFRNDRELEDLLEYLLDDDGGLKTFEKEGYNLVRENHLWQKRATALRDILNGQLDL